jgi:hypothetical protein
VLGKSINAQNAMIVNGRVVYVLPSKIYRGDTLPYIRLSRPVYIIPPRVFKNERERRRYSRLVRDIKKVYPLAVKARNIFYFIQDSINKIQDPGQRKVFLNEQEKLLREQFEGDIRRLTFRQGRLLIKLIDRETQHTSYELIKQLKGSFSAFFWQTVARFFGENLKDQYDPHDEDKYIEEIVHKIENGQL